MEILFVHLLNNYTGSPRILSNILDAFSNRDDVRIHLLTSFSEGCLSEHGNVIYHNNHYKWSASRIHLAWNLVISHIYQFCFILFSRNYDLVYVNTILPFGAAFAAKLRGMKIIYHIHEYYPNPSVMQKICVFFTKKCASRIVFVSEYVKSSYGEKFAYNKNVIYNSVSKQFHDVAEKISLTDDVLTHRYESRKIIMPCALKKYKGVLEFVKLAEKLPDFFFELILSNSEEETKQFFKDMQLPMNLCLRNEIKDMTKIYEQASLVMNLSIPHGIDRIIETFSMILLEGFEFGLPCLAPNYGGPKELIEDGKSGFLIETLDTKKVIEKLRCFFSDFSAYKRFSLCAKERSLLFSNEKFSDAIKNEIEEETNE